MVSMDPSQERLIQRIQSLEQQVRDLQAQVSSVPAVQPAYGSTIDLPSPPASLAHTPVKIDIERYAREQSVLYAVTAAASNFLDPQEMLNTILDLVLSLCSADAGWIVLLESWPEPSPRVAAWQGKIDSFHLLQPATYCEYCLFTASHPRSTHSQVPLPIVSEACPAAEALAGAGLLSHIGIPLNVGQRTLGILYLAWYAPPDFSPSDYQLLINIGHQVGLAMRNAQLYQAASQTDRLRLLNDINSAAGASLDLDTILRQVLERTCLALHSTAAAIALQDAQRGELTFVQVMGRHSERLLGQRQAVGEKIAGWVAAHSQTFYANDLNAESHCANSLERISGMCTRSILAAPLVAHGRVIGVIEMFDRRAGAFTHEDSVLLEAVASTTAVAIENARLYSDACTRAARLETLNQIALTLTASLDYEVVAHNAIAQIQRLFSSEGTALLAYNPLTHSLSFIHALVNADPVDQALLRDVEPVLSGWDPKAQPALLGDAASCPLVNDPLFTRLLPHPPGAAMTAPLVTSDRMLGVVVVASSRRGQFNADDLATLQAITATLAVTLENASLYQDLKALLREREITQAQIVQSEKLSALGRLAASIAHEINNPLQAMQGCLTLFGDEMIGARREEKLTRYLYIVQSEIERISVIVRRMQTFSRPDNEGVQRTDLHAVLQNVLDLTAKQFQHTGITVEIQRSAEDIVLQANQDHLKQIFLNLLLNAMDAMPEGGVITLTTQKDLIARQGQPPRPAVRIVIQDTGSGIPPDMLDRIFEPFYTSKAYGTGLGLHIVYGLVQSHQGEISVTSRPGQGATFTLLLPLEMQ